MSRQARFLGCPNFDNMTRSLEAVRSLALGQSIGQDFHGKRGLVLTNKFDIWAQADIVFPFFLSVNIYFLKRLGFLANLL